jgi:hypothetical protein
LRGPRKAANRDTRLIHYSVIEIAHEVRCSLVVSCYFSSYFLNFKAKVGVLAVIS